MPYRHVGYSLTYTVQSDARVTRAEFGACVEALKSMTKNFNARHGRRRERRFTVKGTNDAVRVGGLPLAGGPAELVLRRQPRHTAAMERLRDVQASARQHIGEMRRAIARETPNTPAHRRAAEALHDHETAHRDVLLHDFAQLHDTVVFGRSTEAHRLYLQCVLFVWGTRLPQLELDFVDRRGGTLSNAVGNGRRAGPVRRELEQHDAGG